MNQLAEVVNSYEEFHEACLASFVKPACHDQSSHGTLKFNYILKLNRWNKLILCLLVQIQQD